MEKIKLAILFGGKSSEYLISLHSAESVIKHIPQDKYEIIMVGITEEGKWLSFNGNIAEIENNTWFNNSNCCEMFLSPDPTVNGFIKLNKNGSYETIKVDCIFPVLHGKNGEDGTIQGLCELANLPCVGCKMLSSAISMDKEFTHITCNAAGIKTAPFIAVIKSDDIDYEMLYKQAIEKLSLPIFIKPANSGSSHGISKIRNFEEFKSGLILGFKHDEKIILEKTINGFEIGCAVLGNKSIEVGEVDEIEMYHDFFDYEEKYSQKTTKIHCPARIDEELITEAKKIAKKAYIALRSSGMTRVDMFLTPQNEIFLNEVNTIPGLTSLSRYPQMVKVGLNLNYEQLIDKLVQLAMDNINQTVFVIS